MQRLLEIFIHLTRYTFHRLFVPYAHFGTRVAIDREVRIYNPRAMRIGSRVHLQDRVWLNVVSDLSAVSLSIGDDCDLGRGCFLSAHTSVILEKSVLLAPNVCISDHSHAFDDPTRPIIAQGITEPKPVRIGTGTWIGINAVILPGVTIGRNCVIGANSVVNRDIPDYSVAAGSPARIIKKISKKG